MATKKNGKKQEAPGSFNPTQEEIRERAYSLYLARNGATGSALEDWLKAEEELKARRSILPAVD